VLALIDRIAREDWSVARLEEFLDREKKPKPPEIRWKSGMMKDVRLFLGSVDHALSAIRSAGFDATAQREETDTEIVLTIRLPKKA